MDSPYKRDVVADFVRDTRARGVIPGFYYSVVSNAYLRVNSGSVVPSAPVGPHQVHLQSEFKYS